MPNRNFAVCVDNVGHEASLKLSKIYEVLPDPGAAVHGQVRVIDESGDDYLYPESFFGMFNARADGDARSRVALDELVAQAQEQDMD